MKLSPVLTEKSLNEVKKGRYTFKVLPGLNKNEIRKGIEHAFGVHVTSIRTILLKELEKKNLKGYKTRIKAVKKAIVVLKKDEKIDLFEESGKGKSKK
ncbi:50S ribosomal protein L23 [Candidatus Woesebacteria bacterium]|nr:50S ribosomal protein L23 [Candidatus Woesebacteria bacterium]